MPLGRPRRGTPLPHFSSQKSAWRVSRAFAHPTPRSQLTMVPSCNIQHQYNATATLCSHGGAELCRQAPTHLEGVEEVPEGPGIYHVVVHGEEEGDDDTGNTCGHGGRHSVSGKTPGERHRGQHRACTHHCSCLLFPSGLKIKRVSKLTTVWVTRVI